MTETNDIQSSSSWWSWSYWTGANPAVQKTPVVVPNEPGPSVPSPIEQATGHHKIPVVTEEVTYNLVGFDRIKALYQHPCMETDVAERVMRMSFLGGFLMGGATGYVSARQTYEVNNVGRKYLSPSDAVKRKMDYAIVRFAKSGFGMGFKCAFISGSIVVLSTHLAAYRQKFSSWYFPALSALVGGVFTFPLGIIGCVKACGLGITSGLTLSAVTHLYALSIDKTVDEAYWIFKRDYEKELKEASLWDARVSEVMKNEGIWWRQQAVRKLKEADEKVISTNDA